MKVYFNYNGLVDNNYSLIPLNDEEMNTKVNKKQLCSFLEKNKIIIINEHNIRYFNKHQYGWIKLNENDIVSLKNKFLIETQLYYSNNIRLQNEISTFIQHNTNELQYITNNLITSINNNNNENLFQLNICVCTAQPLRSEYPLHYFEENLNYILDAFRDYNNRNVQLDYVILNNSNLHKLIPPSNDTQFTIYNIYLHSAYDNNGNVYFIIEGDNRNEYKCDKDFLSLLNLNSHSNCLYLIITELAEDIYNLFLSLNVDNFIIIHVNDFNNTIIKLFIYKFYSFLLKNESIRSAYMNTFHYMKASTNNNNSEYHCCCFHSHTEKCLWKKSICKGTSMLTVHDVHMGYGCLCEYKLKHIHKELVCKWVRTLNPKIMKKFKIKSNNCLHKIVFCCCRPEIQHDEVIMVYEHIESENVRFINGNNNEVSYEHKVTRSCLDLGYSMILGKHCQLYGRNNDVEKIVSLILNEGIKVIVIYGDRSIGKIELAKYIGVYVYERNIVNNVMFINNNNNNKEVLFNNKNDTLFIIKEDNDIIFEQYLHNSNNNNKYIIVINPIEKLNINNIKNVHYYNLKPISHIDVLKYINNEEPSFIHLNGTEKRNEITEGSDLEILLNILKGNFTYINILLQVYKTRNKFKEISFTDLIKQIKEKSDNYFIYDDTIITSNSTNISIIYLFLYTSWSFMDLKLIYNNNFDNIREHITLLFPIIIKRQKDLNTIYQIQPNIKSKIQSTIKFPSNIKNKIQSTLLIKTSLILKLILISQYKNTLIHCMPLYKFKPFNNGIIDDNNLLPYPDSYDRYGLLIQNVLSHIIVNRNYIGLGIEKDIKNKVISELAMYLPLYLYVHGNMACLNVIKMFIDVFDKENDFNMKARVLLLFVFIHCNCGISGSIDNFEIEKKCIDEAKRNFDICSNNDGIEECVVFKEMIQQHYNINTDDK